MYPDPNVPLLEITKNKPQQARGYLWVIIHPPESHTVYPNKSTWQPDKNFRVDRDSAKTTKKKTANIRHLWGFWGDYIYT